MEKGSTLRMQLEAFSSWLATNRGTGRAEIDHDGYYERLNTFSPSVIGSAIEHLKESWDGEGIHTFPPIEEFIKAIKAILTADNQPEPNMTISAVIAEYKDATKKFGKFNSPHEGLSVIREEYMELEREVFWGTSNDQVTAEAIQLAAMSLRFLIDTCGCPDIEGE